jgi:hypothetical protein
MNQKEKAARRPPFARVSKKSQHLCAFDVDRIAFHLAGDGNVMPFVPL